jgi:phenylpropionate dioxygenase-like ring-hydroxylating dioxygenase large terminal subunit
MLSKEQNDLLTKTGPGTPGGELLRRYWQPVALAEEIPPGSAPLPVRVMSADLVLFRDEDGRPGLLGLHCSHRGADLSYGRLEDGGLRCLYHGWLFDRGGRCLEQPGEPVGSTFHERIRHLAYPCQEKAGIVFAYLGPGEPPLLPNYWFLDGPEDCLFVYKYYHDCNYLQSNEGNIDPSHLSYLHHFMKEDEARLRPGSFSAPQGATISSNSLFGQDQSPQLEVEETDFGVRIFSVRKAGPENVYLRVTNFVYPNAFCIPIQGGWHVPIDDTHHWKYQIMRSATPLDRAKLKQDMLLTMTPDYHHIRNRANRYLQDREEMKSRSIAGLGPVFQNHDNWATEAAGPVQDRPTEHLGYTDKAIAKERQLLLRAIRQVQEGGDPPHLIRSPEQNHLSHLVSLQEVIPNTADWRNHWRTRTATPVPVGAGR